MIGTYGECPYKTLKRTLAAWSRPQPFTDNANHAGTSLSSRAWGTKDEGQTVATAHLQVLKIPEFPMNFPLLQLLGSEDLGLAGLVWKFGPRLASCWAVQAPSLAEGKSTIKVPPKASESSNGDGTRGPVGHSRGVHKQSARAVTELRSQNDTCWGIRHSLRQSCCINTTAASILNVWSSAVLAQHMPLVLVGPGNMWIELICLLGQWHVLIKAWRSVPHKEFCRHLQLLMIMKKSTCTPNNTHG